MTPYRVLFVDHTAALSGGEIALSRLIEAAGDRIDAHVVLGEDGELRARLEQAGATVHVLPLHDDVRDVRKDAVRPGGVGVSTAWQLALYTRRLRRLIRELRPDVVHTNSLKAAVYGGLAARLAGARLVWHVRDRIELDYLPRAAVLLVGLMARRVPHAIIANSETTLATVPSSRPSQVIHSTVVYDALDASHLASPHEVHRSLSRFGVLGRLAPWKGQHVFLEAFARAFPDGDHEAVLIGSAMFGEDEYVQSLHALARRLGIADRVDFRGFRTDVWAELTRLDVLVHTSTIPEPFGQVVVEGMAARLPVVAADAGGPAEIIRDGVDGLLVPPDDVGALADTLRRLSADPSLAARLGDAGRQSVERFGPEQATARLLEVYDRVARR